MLTLSISDWFTKLKSDFILNFVQDDRWKLMLDGLKNTLIITLFAVILGIILGIILAIIRSSHDKMINELQPGFGKFLLKFANLVATIYLTIIRGTPVVVQLLIAYFIIFASSNNGVFVAIIAFGINSGAYVAEIVRSGIMSIDNGQFEAGRSLGLNYIQTMVYVILPQAFKNILPALANEFIVLLKETSVAGYVAIVDLTKAGDKIRGITFSPFMPLIAVAVVYLILVTIFSRLVSMLERRLRNNER